MTGPDSTTFQFFGHRVWLLKRLRRALNSFCCVCGGHHQAAQSQKLHHNSPWKSASGIFCCLARSREVLNVWGKSVIHNGLRARSWPYLACKNLGIRIYMVERVEGFGLRLREEGLGFCLNPKPYKANKLPTYNEGPPGYELAHTTVFFMGISTMMCHMNSRYRTWVLPPPSNSLN